MIASTTITKWIVTWFPPEKDARKVFSEYPKALKFARSENVRPWNPILVEQETTIIETILWNGLHDSDPDPDIGQDDRAYIPWEG